MDILVCYGRQVGAASSNYQFCSVSTYWLSQSGPQLFREFEQIRRACAQLSFFAEHKIWFGDDDLLKQELKDKNVNVKEIH